MHVKKLYVSALAGLVGLALGIQVDAADINQVRSVRDYVIKNHSGTEAVEGGGTSYHLTLDGEKFGYKRPILNDNPGDSSKINIQAGIVPFMSDNLLVVVRDIYKEPNGVVRTVDTIVIDGGKEHEGIKLDGIVDLVNEVDTTYSPTGRKIFEIDRRMGMMDKTQTEKFQNLYDKVIGGVYELSRKK